MLTHSGAGMGATYCNVRSGGRTASGKALLETSEVIFRGDFRLKIPFASLKSVTARDGQLHLKWPDGAAVFELGEQAKNGRTRSFIRRALLEKLGIKPGIVISAVAMPDATFVQDLRAQAKSFSDSKPLSNQTSTPSARQNLPNWRAPRRLVTSRIAWVLSGMAIPRAGRTSQSCRSSMPAGPQGWLT